MNKLVIVANPSSKSFSHSIAEKIMNLSKQKWDTVEVLDLYTTDLKQDFLRYEDKKDVWNDETTKQIQKKILWADELVLIFPIWWGDAPAIMKNFFDCNFNTWFAFNYVERKKVWLLTWKSARIIATSGAPAFFYKIMLHIQLLWNMNRIGFCWIKQKSFTIFWDVDLQETDKNKYLQEIEKLV